MRQALVVLLTLLVSPVAVAECPSSSFGMGGSGLGSAVSKADRRAVEALLGAPVDAVVCSRMTRVWRRMSGFVAKAGFFVLTPNEVVFVSDGKVKEVQFRANFDDVREQPGADFGPGFDYTIGLDVTSDAGQFRVELACDAIARRLVDELERRKLIKTRAPPQLPPGVKKSCD